MRRLARRVFLMMLSMGFLAGCATSPTDSHSTRFLSEPQKHQAECLDLASQVAQRPPGHARGRASRDRHLTMCLESR